MPTLRDRVVDTVEEWCGFDGFDTDNALSILWGVSRHANSVPFKPQAVSLLIAKLQSEFQPPAPDARDLRNWGPGSFAPGGIIDTVEGLVSAVLFAPLPAIGRPSSGANPLSDGVADASMIEGAFHADHTAQPSKSKTSTGKSRIKKSKEKKNQ